MIERATAKNFLKQAAHPALWMLFLSFSAGNAYAAGILFDVTGTFDGGATLSGTIEIDTTGNEGILSEDLTVDSNSSPYTFSSVNSGSFSSFGSNDYYYSAYSTGTPASQLYLDIFVGNTESFDGYTGGGLCSDSLSCGGSETDFEDPPLSSGSLTEVPEAPEPATALLTLAGAAALAALRVASAERNSKAN